MAGKKKQVEISNDDRLPDSVFSTNSFRGSRAMVNFGGVNNVKRSGSLLFRSVEQEEISDEYLDEYLNKQEKKRRLSVDQVQFLERNFETGNKLEPDRKVQLAKELGLKPRQIAVWFQNRRARWKTKQIETDYDSLHASYESLKADYESILKENENLKTQILHLKHNGSFQNATKENFDLCGCNKLQSESMPQQGTACITSEGEESELPAVDFKNEERISTASDETDVDNSVLTNRIHPSFLQSGDSSHVFELNHPYTSMTTEDDLGDNELLLQPVYTFHGFPVEDHHAFSFWSY